MVEETKIDSAELMGYTNDLSNGEDVYNLIVNLNLDRNKALKIIDFMESYAEKVKADNDNDVEDYENQIDDLEAQLDDANDDYWNVQDEADQLQSDNDELRDQIDRLNERIAELEGQQE